MEHEVTSGAHASANARTVASYEEIAADYAAGTTGPRVLASGLARLVGAIPGGHVLEIGSGPGWDADALEDAGLTVRRTDVTQGFIDGQRARGKVVDRLDVIRDDLGGPYDGVVMLHVLQHVEADDLPGVLAKIAGALRPGGQFLVSVPLGDEAGWEVGESGTPYYRALRPAAQFVTAVERAGLVPGWTERSVEDEERGWFCVVASRSEGGEFA